VRSSCGVRIACAAALPAHSGSAVWSGDGAIARRICAWDAVAASSAPGVGASHVEANAAAGLFLDGTGDTTTYQPLVGGGSGCVLVAARHDTFVPSASSMKIAAAW
jgi:hypothetical protein